MQSWNKWCDKIILYSFYILFFFVPLFFTGDTSELFELNKMWLTFWLAIVICGTWFCKMALEKQIKIHRTPLDIPILLFLLSQFIATIFTLDQHVSWWGYYSRFNGGMLSMLTYVLLYYAAVTNLKRKDIFSLLWLSFGTGVVVSLWGLPSHFGHDPTCFVFRGTYDVSCWTDAFKPTIRIFSTLGQPAWLAAYLTIIIPITIALFLKNAIKKTGSLFSSQHIIQFSLFVTATVLFYLDLLYTDTRAGFLGFWLGYIFFWVILFWNKTHHKQLLQACGVFTATLLLVNFFTSTPVAQINKFSLASLLSHTQAPAPSPILKIVHPSPTVQPAVHPDQLDNGITDSGKIRLYVWQGALDAWKAHPLFGTGVETYAFAYYLYRPVGHNMTSEWDYLYNKAHNEFLNYLATTGLFGLGSYLFFLGGFMFLSLRYLWQHKQNPEHAENTIITAAFLAAYAGIITTNFFGFSVVIINLYTFLVPAFFFLLINEIKDTHSFRVPKIVESSSRVNAFQWTILIITLLVACYFELILVTYWNADKAYGLGHNLDDVNHYQDAYQHLVDATTLRPDEPVFQDELSINQAALAAIALQQKDINGAKAYAQQAKAISDTLITTYPNNLLFLKSRVRIFSMLGQDNPQILQFALDAMKKANQLAPTDAKILYNLGVLYGKTGDVSDGITVLQKTIAAKPDYRDAYFALGLFYHDAATDKNGKVINPALEQKAVASLHYILDTMSNDDGETIKTLAAWKEK